MFKNIMTACLIVLAVCAFNPKTFGKETQKMHTLTLALNGKANATIIIAPEATKAAQFAALDESGKVSQNFTDLQARDVFGKIGRMRADIAHTAGDPRSVWDPCARRPVVIRNARWA